MKLFVFSDCHGFYTELKNALDAAGFEKGNPDHLLIGLGDYIDRGMENRLVIEYLESVPNKVLIKGNHEDLAIDLLNRKFPYNHDYHNGTFNTICELGGALCGNNFKTCCTVAESKLRPFINSMVNYYETKNYIFVHSWIPLNVLDDLPMYYIKGRVFEKMDNWREAREEDWKSARWGNPYELAKKGLLPDKVLIFGHWNVSWPRHHWAWSDEAPPEFGEGADFSIYYGDGFIGIDGCVSYSKKINILVIEGENIYDQN